MASTPQVRTNIYILQHCKIIIGIDIFNKKQYPYRLRHWLQGHSILANELIVSPYDQKGLLGTYTKDSYSLPEIVRKEAGQVSFHRNYGLPRQLYRVWRTTLCGR